MGLAMSGEEGTITICATAVKRGLLIAVRDNGKGMDAEERKALRQQLNNLDQQRAHIGLSNINHRIKLHFGDELWDTHTE